MKKVGKNKAKNTEGFPLVCTSGLMMFIKQPMHLSSCIITRFFRIISCRH